MDDRWQITEGIRGRELRRSDIRRMELWKLEAGVAVNA
jgi:hypothetical protein